MADGNGADASSVKRKFEKPILPWRQIKDWPTDIFIKDVLDWLYESAYPEQHEGLFRNKIPKDVPFYIIRDEITLDGKKRLGDNAPCPMCTTNKFLTGSLVFIPSMECCAFIGHCCADKKTRADAAREFRQRSRRDHEESYLLNNLLLIPARLQALEALRPTAIEARRLYRQFRKEASRIQLQLRQVKKNYGGRLLLSEIIRGGEEDAGEDYVGPSGIKGRGSSEIETREHDYGLMAGGLATIKNYDPVEELHWLIRQLRSIDTLQTEDEVVDFIVTINERQRGAAVVIMEAVDAGAAKFAARINEFLSFFTRENAEQLNAYGQSPHNSLQFSAEFGKMRDRPCLVIKFGKDKCVMHVGEPCWDFQFTWPEKAS